MSKSVDKNSLTTAELLSDEKMKSKILDEIHLFLSEYQFDSIIFEINGQLLLNIRSLERYFIDEQENLYENLLFEIVPNDKLSVHPTPVYIKNYNTPKLIEKVGETEVRPYKPTGVVYEIEEKPLLFKNFDILSDFFINTTYTKQQAYSLLLSNSFPREYKRICNPDVKFIRL